MLSEIDGTNAFLAGLNLNAIMQSRLSLTECGTMESSFEERRLHLGKAKPPSALSPAARSLSK